MTPNEMAREIRRLIIEISFKAGVGHIGSCLSIADILSALYASDGGVLNVQYERECTCFEYEDEPCSNCDLGGMEMYEDRDRFVLSKGHAALALYCALHLRGFIIRDELDTFCQEGSRLYTHPNHEVPGVEYSTGSLGMGLSYACGEALAAKKQGSSRKVYCLLSDAELQEGSTWEAIMFAAHHKLDNLIAIVDANGQQALGNTQDICQPDYYEMFKGAGWAWQTCNTCDWSLAWIGSESGTDQPKAFYVSTTFGDGVSFMKSSLKWHYSPLSKEEYELALIEVTT